VLPLRSNVPALAEYVFERLDPGFPARARQAGCGMIVAGMNYGQGSSREHAALVPMYLGVRVVAAKSFARIHMANLVNFGILPLIFPDGSGYEGFERGDVIEIPDAAGQIKAGLKIVGRNLTRNAQLRLSHQMTSRQVDIVMAGGLLNFVRNSSNGGIEA